MFSDMDYSVPSPSRCAALQCGTSCPEFRSPGLRARPSLPSQQQVSELPVLATYIAGDFHDPLEFGDCLEQLREFAESTVLMVTVLL